jgi:hypothetical protein
MIVIESGRAGKQIILTVPLAFDSFACQTETFRSLLLVIFLFVNLPHDGSFRFSLFARLNAQIYFVSNCLRFFTIVCLCPCPRTFRSLSPTILDLCASNLDYSSLPLVHFSFTFVVVIVTISFQAAKKPHHLHL